MRATLTREIREKIEGTIRSAAPGDRLPSERALCIRLHVSRITVRRALEELQVLGAIATQPGRGRFVARQPYVKVITKFSGFAADMAEHQKSAYASGISISVRDMRKHESVRFSWSGSQSVVCFRRVRSDDSGPLVLKESSIPECIGRNLQTTDMQKTPLYDVLARVGVTVARSETWIRSDLASEASAVALHLSVGDPVLVTEEVVYDVMDRAVELVTSFYRGDHVVFTAQTVTRSRPTTPQTVATQATGVGGDSSPSVPLTGSLVKGQGDRGAATRSERGDLTKGSRPKDGSGPPNIPLRRDHQADSDRSLGRGDRDPGIADVVVSPLVEDAHWLSSRGHRN